MARMDTIANAQRCRPALAAAAWLKVIASLDRHLGIDREAA